MYLGIITFWVGFTFIKGHKSGSRAVAEVSYRGRPDSIPGPSTWDLWSTKWKLDRIFSEYSKTCGVGHPCNSATCHILITLLGYWPIPVML